MSEIFSNIDKKLLAKFKTYHLENPSVYRAFVDASREMFVAGKIKYSAWTIINKIRWDFDLATKDKVFKINNDFIALYARLVIYHNPEFKDFFELRTMKPTDRRESSEEKYRRKTLGDSTTTKEIK